VSAKLSAAEIIDIARNRGKPRSTVQHSAVPEGADLVGGIKLLLARVERTDAENARLLALVEELSAAKLQPVAPEAVAANDPRIEGSVEISDMRRDAAGRISSYKMNGLNYQVERDAADHIRAIRCENGVLALFHRDAADETRGITITTGPVARQ
jgi:hypothetical protein